MSVSIADHLLALPATERRNLVLAELKRKSRVKTIFNGIPIQELRELVARLNEVVDELEIDYSSQLQGDTQLSKANEILSLLNVKYFKDGKSWSGRGRRPEPFKGLSLADLEKYRIDIQRADI